VDGVFGFDAFILIRELTGEVSDDATDAGGVARSV
jgi:hypothetical protein